MQIAIDVALIPDDQMASQAVHANQSLLAEWPGEIRLGLQPDAEVGLPHISLGMFFVAATDLELAVARLQTIRTHPTALALNVRQLSIRKNSHGSYTYSWDIELSKSLQEIHEATMASFADLGNQDGLGGVSSFMATGNEARESDAQWVRSFAKQAAFENFDPHVTLGFGSRAGLIVPTEIPTGYSRALGVYRLGAGCTCRKVVGERRLVAEG